MDSLIFLWKPMLLCDPLWVWDSPCIIGLGLNNECAGGCKGPWVTQVFDGRNQVTIYINIMGRIPTPLYYLLTAHCSIDVTSGIGDREGVGFPVPDVYHVCTLPQLILFGNMASRGTHINIVYCSINLYWCFNSWYLIRNF